MDSHLPNFLLAALRPVAYAVFFYVLATRWELPGHRLWFAIKWAVVRLLLGVAFGWLAVALIGQLTGLGVAELVVRPLVLVPLCALTWLLAVAWATHTPLRQVTMRHAQWIAAGVVLTFLLDAVPRGWLLHDLPALFG